MITKQIVANKLADYLRHGISRVELADWAEAAMLEGDFEESAASTLAEVVARLGVSNVDEFGLTWEECEDVLRQLGYAAQVEIVAA